MRKKITEEDGFVLSLLLIKGEMYGLQIIEEIEKSSKGKICIPKGSIYPLLYRIEKEKLIISRWGEETDKSLGDRLGARRKYYQITNEGKEKLLEIKKTRSLFDI